MPRRKPSDVVVHRIELGSWEREHFGPVASSVSAKPYMQFVSDIMRDNSALLVLAGFLALLLPNLPDGWRDQIGLPSAAGSTDGWFATVKDWLELQNLVGAATAGWWGAYGGLLAGGPWLSLLGGLGGIFSGFIAVEAAEEVAEGIVDWRESIEAQREEAEAGNRASATALLMYVVIMLERIGARPQESTQTGGPFGGPI